MFHKTTLMAFVVFAAALSSGCAEFQAMGGTNTLASLLASQLGVTQDQAMGGAGSVLSLAKETLPGADFSTLTKLIPGADSLMKTATDLGAVTGPITNKAGLEAAFSRLGMAADMVPKFIQSMGEFVGKTGGDAARTLLTSLLG